MATPKVSVTRGDSATIISTVATAPVRSRSGIDGGASSRGQASRTSTAFRRVRAAVSATRAHQKPISEPLIAPSSPYSQRRSW